MLTRNEMFKLFIALAMYAFLTSSCASAPCDCAKQIADTRTFFLELTSDDAHYEKYCMDPKDAKDINAARKAVDSMRELRRNP